MSYSLIPFLLIIIPLAIIIVVIVRKFPQLALLDVENLPEVKLEKKKSEVLKKRVQRRAAEATAGWSKKLQPFIFLLKRLQLAFRVLVGKVEQRVAEEKMKRQANEPKEAKRARKQNAKSLSQEGDMARQGDDFESAEKKYLAAIRLDPKNKDAYRGLGDAYVKMGQLEEAKETYGFVLQLERSDHDTMVKMAGVLEEQGKADEALTYYQEAILLGDHDPIRFAKVAELLTRLGEPKTALEAIKQAVELEPQNPRYLDMLAETSILAQDKAGAAAAYDQLRMVNPDNNKLPLLKEKIALM